jgi:hypothetical protein
MKTQLFVSRKAKEFLAAAGGAFITHIIETKGYVLFPLLLRKSHTYCFYLLQT